MIPQKIIHLPVHMANRAFLPPSIEEVILQSAKIGLPKVEGEHFFHYYSSQGWMVGRTPMVQWRSALAGWKIRWQQRQTRAKSEFETPSASVNTIKWQNELGRVESKMKSIRNSYSEHQSWDMADRNLFSVLKKRRDELLKNLGMAI